MISGEKYEFTKKNVDESPAAGGVYVLYDGQAIVFYGSAPGGGVTIRSRLQAHFRGDEGSCTKSVTHYKREACGNPADREKEELQGFQQRHGRLPRCHARADQD
jgi:hypothetical protein